MAAKVKVTGAFLRHFLSSAVAIAGVVLLMLLTGTVVGDVQGANKNNGIVPVPNGNHCLGGSVLNSQAVHLNSRVHRK